MKRLCSSSALALIFSFVFFAGSRATFAETKSPHGIFQLFRDQIGEGDPCWTNSAIDGVRFRGGWNRVQKKVDGPYDWSGPDQALALAQKHGKQIGISFVALMAPPDGLEAAGCKFVDLSYGHVPWINDPVYLQKWTDFIKAAGAHYDGKVDYIAMGGLGRIIESGIGGTPEDMNTLDALGGLAAWKEAVTKITEAHAAAFKQTPFIFTAAKPYRRGPGAAEALRDVLDTLAPKYPHRFGIMDCGLNSHSRPGYVPNAYVQKYSDTNPVGLQFLTSTRGFNRRQLGGSLAQALDAGVALGAHWIEVYKIDAEDPANKDLFRATAARLKR